MNNIIPKVIRKINKTIKSDSSGLKISSESRRLISLRDDLNKLLELDLDNDDFNRLFCQRLERLISYEFGGPELSFWIDIHDDLLYVLYGPDVRDLIDNIDDLLSFTYEQTEISLTSQSRKRLEEKLKCKHTWFSQPYIDDDNIGDILKEFIYHRQAAIFLDGLNEIVELEERSKIINLIKIFMEDYVDTQNFLSAFDDIPFDVQPFS
ncbi:hypothetical protein I4U23_031357 [Adineta vaga]|nr:hypothetical protein I4U23_031357 [Adineta vaga]